MSITVLASAYGQGASTVTAGRVGVGLAVVADAVGAGAAVVVGGTVVGTGAAESWVAVSHPASRTAADSPSTIPIRTAADPSSPPVGPEDLSPAHDPDFCRTAWLGSGAWCG
jgi:hypothetical protein